MKQFEEGVKHTCTLHFVHITLGIPTQFGFLQHPLFSVNVGQCKVSSLISWTETGAAFGFFFFFTSISNCTCDRLGLPLFLISVFPWWHKQAAISALNCKRLHWSFWLICDSSQSFLYKSQEFTTATSKKWQKMRWYHFLDLIFILYSAINESVRSCPPWTCYTSYIKIALGHWTSILFFSFLSHCCTTEVG